VIGTARQGKHEFLQGLGADELIDYTSSDFAAVVRRLLGIWRSSPACSKAAYCASSWSRPFPLEHAAKAHELSETGRVAGKVVLSP
jgi:NADPH:quinone reductase-like Zn-dependent oxidoreductase